MHGTETTRFFSGQGYVFLATRNSTTGAIEGYTHVGNCPDLKFSLKTDVVEHKESMTGNRLVDMRLQVGKTAEASFTMDSFSSATIAKALYGTVTARTAADDGAEAITSRLDQVVPLTRIKVHSVVIKNHAETITYEENKNYTVDGDSGTIYFMTTAAQTAASAANNIADATDLHVTYHYAASDLIKAFKNAATEYSLMFLGLNTAESNNPVRVTLPKFRPDPMKDFSLITNDLNKWEMSGAVLYDDTLQDFLIIEQITAA